MKTATNVNFVKCVVIDLTPFTCIFLSDVDDYIEILIILFLL